jgi:hypothetical protein
VIANPGSVNDLMFDFCQKSKLVQGENRCDTSRICRVTRESFSKQYNLTRENRWLKPEDRTSRWRVKGKGGIPNPALASSKINKQRRPLFDISTISMSCCTWRILPIAEGLPLILYTILCTILTIYYTIYYTVYYTILYTILNTILYYILYGEM